MVRFAHMADVHLGGWKQPELQNLNFESFTKSIDICIKEKVNFVLIAGDLFDTAFPGIDVLKETFAQFKRLKEVNIACFIIAGSHDYSVSGKTFLDVLEKAGFCKNVEMSEEIGDQIILNPVIHQGTAIYGYPGKKSGLEINNLRKIKLNEAPGLFKILMLHTTLDKAKGTLPIDAIEASLLPKVDYYALGHLHIDFQYENFVYPGPIFPNNFQELEDINHGGFYIVDTESSNALKKIELKLKSVVSLEIEITNTLTATEEIIQELRKKDIGDKIVLLRVKGLIEKGAHSDIKFSKIEEFTRGKKAYSFLKNTHDLKAKEIELEIDVGDTENIEEATIKAYTEENPSGFNSLIDPLMNALLIEKQEGETNENFAGRIMDSSKKVLKF